MRLDSEMGIEDLALELARRRRRAARLKHNIKASQDAWRDWSATMDEVAGLTQRLVLAPAPDLEGLAVKFKAILWLIENNEGLLDRGDLRRLRRFGRDLSVLAGGRS